MKNLDHKTIRILERHRSPNDFIDTEDLNLEKYITRSKIGSIRPAVKLAPKLIAERKALDIEFFYFLRILNILISGKENISKAVKKESFPQVG